MSTRVKLALRQPVEEIERVAVIEANVAEPFGFDRGEGLRHAVDIGLAAEKPACRIGAGFVQEMLAAAEADLEPHARRWVL